MPRIQHIHAQPQQFMVIDGTVTIPDRRSDDNRHTITLRGKVRFAKLANGDYSFKEIGRVGAYHVGAHDAAVGQDAYDSFNTRVCMLWLVNQLLP